MSTAEVDIDALVRGIKQLLTSFTPTIRKAGSTEMAEQAILHLEESDENFHRYEFVKHLRSHIDSNLGKMIEEEIEDHSITPNESAAGQETVVSRITKKVLESAEYDDLTQLLKEHVSVACEHLLENFDTEFMAEGSDKSTLGRTHHKHREVIFSDCDSSLDSSMHQSDVMFMNPDQFEAILEKLDKKRPTEVRQESLKKLLRLTSMDIQNQNCDMWPRIRQGLQDSLPDQDQTLWNMSLKFVAKSLSANSASTREIFTTLVEFLISQFQSVNKGNIPKLRAGLDCKKIEMMKLMKAFRLMNEFQQQVPQYWVRYQEKFVNEVLESTLSLLSLYIGPSSGALALVTPGHFVALIDPHANWISKWMHGHYSRDPLLRMMERHLVVVENAVRSCLEYVESRKSHLAAGQTTFVPGGSFEDILYSGEELEFVYFIHSVAVLGRLLCYKNGRKYFPIKLKDRKEPVTITKLVICLIQLLTQAGCVRSHNRVGSEFEPCRMVVDLLHHLCSSEEVCDICICQDDVIQALLQPISYWLSDTKDTETSVPTEASMLHVADILAHVASNSCGRHHLLYGGTTHSDNRRSAVHVLSQFSVGAVSGKLNTTYTQPPTLAVIGNIIFLCRQLYSSCEGLRVTCQYDLHNAIADAWRVANQEAERSSTPTPSNPGDDKPTTANIVLWEDMLRDNLLNLAATPKGLLLLQQTGCINECVSYMYGRYARKMQVSRYEKFGYGYMMSQVAVTSAGVVALQNTGLVATMVQKVWNVLESGDDHLVHIPRPWPVQHVDKSARKVFTSLANMLSSYEAVYEILGNVPLPTKPTYSFREAPKSLAGIIDRIVLVDTEAKLHSLFNYEQSHMFGLRLMSLLTSCLDTLLLLQTQYKYQQVLLNCQKENTTEASSDILIDQLSLERNYLLVKNYLIGGPSERVLPPRTLIQSPKTSASVFSHTLFSDFPVPSEYSCIVANKPGKIESDLSRFLSGGKKTEKNPVQWLEKCRKKFCSLLTTKPDLAKGEVLPDVLQQVTDTLCSQAEEAIFPLLEFKGNDASVRNMTLTAVQSLGIKMTIRYGSQLKLVAGTSDSEDKLILLVKRVKFYLKQQQRNWPKSALRKLQSGCTGYDWFMATIFLMTQGNVEQTWKFLHKFSSLGASGYLWTDRLHCSVHLPEQLLMSGISPVFSTTCHHIESILQREVSHVYSAFKMSGYVPAQICGQWLRQCFWNYLDWQEICHYVCTCCVLGVDYQVYMCVAVLRHSCHKILRSMQNKELLVILKEEPLVGFKVGDHLEYMQQLESKYRGTVLVDMLNISQP